MTFPSGYARKLRENGREQITAKFLITRQIEDSLLLVFSLFHRGEGANLGWLAKKEGQCKHSPVPASDW